MSVCHQIAVPASVAEGGFFPQLLQLRTRSLGAGVVALVQNPVFTILVNRALVCGSSYAFVTATAYAFGRLRRALWPSASHFSETRRGLTFRSLRGLTPALPRSFLMLKRLALCVTVIATLILTTGAWAQYSPDEGRGGRWSRGTGGDQHAAFSPEERLQRLSKQLNLSDEQKDKIKPILESEAKKMQELRQDNSAASQDRRAKFQQLRQDTLAQIRPILNPDQQKKLDDLIKQQEQRRQHGGGQRQEPQ